MKRRSKLEENVLRTLNKNLAFSQRILLVSLMFLLLGQKQILTHTLYEPTMDALK